MNKVVVTDILNAPYGPVAFNQISHKNRKYEGICPWCTCSLGKVQASNYGELYFQLIPIQSEHMDTCVGRESLEMNVMIKNK